MPETRTPALWEMYARTAALLRAQLREAHQSLGRERLRVEELTGLLARQEDINRILFEEREEIDLILADYLAEKARQWDRQAQAGTITAVRVEQIE